VFVDPQSLDIYSYFFDAVENLYKKMDQAYDEAAEAHGFNCMGCEDNCCYTKFYHHTHVEYLYLYKGLVILDKEKQEKVRRRATDANEQILLAEARGDIPRVICPINSKGLCSLYQYRPLICRLHGIPNEFHPSSGKKVTGPGCTDFDRQCGNKAQVVFDRTPFYIEMAAIERLFKTRFGVSEKFKKTVAQMLMSETVDFK